MDSIYQTPYCKHLPGRCWDVSIAAIRYAISYVRRCLDSEAPMLSFEAEHDFARYCRQMKKLENNGEFCELEPYPGPATRLRHSRWEHSRPRRRTILVRVSCAPLKRCSGQRTAS